ncbi:hypothetical protein GLOTRDRAFT_96311 [Gloeophyllum trabeum ATCC 11539]|uniref:Uncharacterized protein n=1 Tax=Gloeophyllum trabeum (strain ATCC 11539 / FP-39264 / Madison 617) TaxID=670483 RepID=S7PW88_GLOTA|nr:uncharacterized protein GLOTRDRAFT_96311 [Gloeophyllum trabeum ATCC 11539]EPQ51582.1 hypothetical protein GLOTRDRAFT_96311 [Gloeophyllum trabeum ATCC 11539]
MEPLYQSLIKLRRHIFNGEEWSTNNLERQVLAGTSTKTVGNLIASFIPTGNDICILSGQWGPKAPTRCIRISVPPAAASDETLSSPSSSEVYYGRYPFLSLRLTERTRASQSTGDSEYMLQSRFNFTKHLSDASSSSHNHRFFPPTLSSSVGSREFPAGLLFPPCQLTLQLSSLLNFCIALNMQLVIVHGVDGRKAEKYYVLGSGMLSLWDGLVKECWYANDNTHQRLVWQISTQLLWTGLTVIGEVCSSMILITFLWRHIFRRKRIVQSVNSIANHSTVASTSAVGSQAARTAGGKGTPRADSVFSRRGRQADHVRAYKGIVIRIGERLPHPECVQEVVLIGECDAALYPLVSCIINLTSIVCVIHTTDYNFLLLSTRSSLDHGDLLYGARGIVYGLLATTDPALIRAVRSFLHRDSKSSSYGPAVVRVELTTTTFRDPPQPDELEFEAQSPSEEVGSLSMGYKYPPQVGMGSGSKSPALGDRRRFSEAMGESREGDTDLEAGGVGETSLDLEREAFQKQI